MQRYRQLGMPAEAARIERKVRELAPAVAGEMKVVSVDLEISEEDLKKFVEEISGQTLMEGAMNMVGQ